MKKTPPKKGRESQLPVDRMRTSNRKSPEVTSPEVTESDRVRMRYRYILYYYSSSDTEGVPSGVRMRNRKLWVQPYTLTTEQQQQQ
jgi:hypothetical protein